MWRFLLVLALILVYPGSHMSAQGRPARPATGSMRVVVPASPIQGPRATFEYWLPSPAKKVIIEVLDGAGTVVRTFEGPTGEGTPTANKDRNVFAWDVRYEGPVSLDETATGEPVRIPGPYALHGSYEVRVTADGQSASGSLLVLNSRLGSASDDEARERLTLALQIRDWLSQVNQTVRDLRAMKAQVADRANKAKSPPVGLAADVVNRRLGEVETPLVALSTRSSELYRAIEASPASPAEQNRAAMKVLPEEIAAALDRVRGVLRNEVAAFNRMLGNAQMPLVEVPQRLRELMPAADSPKGGSQR